MRLFAETVSGTVEAWQNDEAELRDCTSSEVTPDPMQVCAGTRLDACTHWIGSPFTRSLCSTLCV